MEPMRDAQRTLCVVSPGVYDQPWYFVNGERVAKDTHDRVRALEDEIERLRERLSWIADADPMRASVVAIQDIAKLALGE